MESFVESFITGYGYLAVFILILSENLFPPIPSEIILTLGGFLTTSLNMNVFIIIGAATLGSVVGAGALYWVGKKVNEDVLRGFLEKHYSFFRVKGKDLDKVFKLMDKYGNAFVFFGRMIPVVRSLISIPAGMVKMNFRKFLVLTTLGTLIWNSVLISLGKMLGENWNDVVIVLDNYSEVVKIIIIMVFVIYAFKYMIRRNKRRI